MQKKNDVVSNALTPEERSHWVDARVRCSQAAVSLDFLSKYLRGDGGSVLVVNDLEFQVRQLYFAVHQAMTLRGAAYRHSKKKKAKARRKRG